MSGRPRTLLASASPQRQGILSALGIEFEAVPSGIDELTTGEAEELVLENARSKARAVGKGRQGVLVIGCDTDVVLDGRVIGKPADRLEAERQLRELAGRGHRVLSGLVVIGPDGGERAGISETEVVFHPLDDGLLGLYLDSGEWEGRAGGYAIQALGSVLVSRIEGDFSNVVGLPVPLLLELAPELLGRPGA